MLDAIIEVHGLRNRFGPTVALDRMTFTVQPVRLPGLEQLAPMTAGLAIHAIAGVRSLPISPWAGLGVLAGWAAAAMLAGSLLLRLRDV